jgi:hypothetical protein
MTLPASFPISMSQIAAELGLSLPLSISHPWVEALANKSGLPVSFSDLLGKTAQFNGNISFTSGSFSTGFTPTLFGGTVLDMEGLYSGGVLTQVTLNFSSNPPVYRGNFLLVNHTTGQSIVVAYAGGNQWNNNAPPAGFIVGSNTYNFTVKPN